ncbi:hypothetical protein HB904_04325 [Listeria booriae]|uniref:Uncharacterized protein n=1 Tax=Listeria booriae TaxID=1552123 RepID=A0A842AGL6_9LIST|nr:hypothetical protein [Listeria booriae]MBC1615400.1 hypothetical protein [Listeria booriae]
MTIIELRESIEKHGLITGFDSETRNLIIISKGYQMLGKINQNEAFNVHMNKHFNRVVGTEEQHKIFKAIFDFIKTPINEREGGAAE